MGLGLGLAHQWEYSVKYCSKIEPKAGLYSATSLGHFSNMKRIERMSSEALRTCEQQGVLHLGLVELFAHLHHPHPQRLCVTLRRPLNPILRPLELRDLHAKLFVVVTKPFDLLLGGGGGKGGGSGGWGV